MATFNSHVFRSFKDDVLAMPVKTLTTIGEGGAGFINQTGLMQEGLLALYILKLPALWLQFSRKKTVLQSVNKHCSLTNVLPRNLNLAQTDHLKVGLSTEFLLPD